MKVFLSSTYLDLIEHRKSVVNALRTMGEDVEHMEIFGARDEEPTKASLKEIDECHVLVGIYAYRYGTVPKGSKTSVTEQEYLYAASKKMPILVFVVNEDHDWPPKKMDNSLAKIKKFKARASSEHTPAYFTTPDNLATQIVAAVGKHAKKLQTKKRSKSSAKSSSRREAVSKEVVKGVRGDVRGSTLPNQPYFFGRDKELAIIADAISPESRTWGALIDGPGGIGKTALAVRAAHLAPATLFERKIFITATVRELTPEGEKPLKDFSRDNYFSMLSELALELGEEWIPRLVPDERADLLRMAMAGKKTLKEIIMLETHAPLSSRTLPHQSDQLTKTSEVCLEPLRSGSRPNPQGASRRLPKSGAYTTMKRVEENKAREKRIATEVTVDAYGSEEVLSGWICYLEDNLAFPFEAECTEERKISPLLKGEKVTALELLTDDMNIDSEFFVLIEWSGRTMGVPLAQLKPLKTDK